MMALQGMHSELVTLDGKHDHQPTWFIPYGGKLWQWETLVNLANDHKFAKFIPAKFYPVKESLM